MAHLVEGILHGRYAVNHIELGLHDVPDRIILSSLTTLPPLRWS